MPPRRFVLSDEVRARAGARAERLATFLTRGDTLADAVVDAMSRLPRGAGWRLLDRALREGIASVPDAPEPFRALFAQVEAMPVWADAEAIARGGELLLRGGVACGIVLAFESLALSYCAPAGNKPLVFSGRLREQTANRLDETARYVHAVCTPGGMSRDGEGFAATVKVRLVHAQVRRALERDPRWSAEWGTPINQHDLAAANVLFSGALIDGLHKLGISTSREEQARYLGLWRYVGYLIGVDQELLCATYAEARALMELIRDTQGRPDDDSRALIDALVHAGVQAARSEAARTRAQKLVPFHQGLCRALIGDDFADAVGLPRHGWRHTLTALRPLLTGLDTARKLPLGNRVAYAAGKRYWELTTRRGMAALDFGLRDALAAPLRGMREAD